MYTAQHARPPSHLHDLRLRRESADSPIQSGNNNLHNDASDATATWQYLCDASCQPVAEPWEDESLAYLIERWSSLPAYVQVAIMTLAQGE